MRCVPVEKLRKPKETGNYWTGKTKMATKAARGKSGSTKPETPRLVRPKHHLIAVRQQELKYSFHLCQWGVFLLKQWLNLN